MGFLVIGCFWGRPRLRFTAGLVGLVGFWGASKVGGDTSKVGGGTSKVGRGTSKVGRGTSSLSSLVGASSLSSLAL